MTEAPAGGPFAPLRHAAFRMLWTATLAANVCVWMNDVAAAALLIVLVSLPSIKHKREEAFQED